MTKSTILRAGLLSVGALWFALAGSLPTLDLWAFDLFLRLRQGHAPPVSARIVHMDIGQEDLDGWASTRQEYAGLAEIMQRLRAQGSQLIVLDLLLKRGEDADFQAIWDEMAVQDDLVLGCTFRESTRLPKGQSQTTGLLYLNTDPDGLLRSYSWVLGDTDPNGEGRSGPSLALAAYLKLNESEWRPEMLRAGQVEFMDINEEAKEIHRRLPQTVLLDERADWRADTTRNFRHFTPASLKQMEARGGPPGLAGAVVFVGYIAPGSGDLGTTPLNRSIPKVAVHSLALNGLMQDAWFQPVPGWLSGLAALGLVGLSWLLARFSRRRLVATWVLVTSVLVGGGALLMSTTHWVPWLVSLTLVWTISLAMEAWLNDKLRHARLQALQVLADSDDPFLLKVLGRYQIVRKLGQGGFATVYQSVPSESLDPKESVALKIVHPASAENPEFRRRFLREIRISCQLHHPSIVKVFKSGDESGLLYMVMELIEGKPLRHYLQPGRACTAADTLQVLRPMLSAMAYAHGMDVVHRDLKPENVMILAASEVSPWHVASVKIVDFGLAFDSQSSQLTRTGDVFGTLDYLAPERIQGASDDPRSDQYALGVIAYEMLAGKSPFPSGNPGEALLFRLTCDPTPLAELRPDLSNVLTDTVARMMARDREQRFASVRDALEALEGL